MSSKPVCDKFCIFVCCCPIIPVVRFVPPRVSWSPVVLLISVLLFLLSIVFPSANYSCACADVPCEQVLFQSRFSVCLLSRVLLCAFRPFGTGCPLHSVLTILCSVYLRIFVSVISSLAPLLTFVYVSALSGPPLARICSVTPDLLVLSHFVARPLNSDIIHACFYSFILAVRASDPSTSCLDVSVLTTCALTVALVHPFRYTWRIMWTQPFPLHACFISLIRIVSVHYPFVNLSFESFMWALNLSVLLLHVFVFFPATTRCTYWFLRCSIQLPFVPSSPCIYLSIMFFVFDCYPILCCLPRRVVLFLLSLSVPGNNPELWRYCSCRNSLYLYFVPVYDYYFWFRLHWCNYVDTTCYMCSADPLYLTRIHVIHPSLHVQTVFKIKPWLF